MMDRLPMADPHSVPRDLFYEVQALASVVRRRWQLVAIGVALCLVLAVLYLAGTRRLYEATTRVLILQQGGRPLSVSGHDSSYQSEGADDLLATHSMIIASPLVVGNAIDSVGLKNLPSLADAVDPRANAIDNLKVVRPDRLAKILQISYRARTTEEATRMLGAITNSYREFLEDKYQRDSSELISLITKARDDLGRELEKLEADYLEFRRSSPTLVVGGRGETLIAGRLEQWDRAAGDAMIKAVQLRTQLELGQQLAKEGTELWAIAHAISQVGGNTESLGATIASRTSPSGTLDFVRQLEAEQHALAERHGPNYSKVLQLRETIDRTRNRAREARSRMEETEVRDLMGAIEKSLAMVDAMRVDLMKGLESDQGLAKEMELELLNETNLRSNLERHRALFNTVVDQLKQAQFVSDYETVRSETIEPINARPQAVHPRVGLTLAIALFLGLALGTTGAAMADRLDRRVRDVDELRRMLDLPVLGYVPAVPKDQAEGLGEFGLVARHRPRSPWAESYRAIRTNLELIRRVRRVRVLMVTSPHPSDGKSVSTSNLAISLAGAGRRVLLVDGDLRKPSQHRIHGLSNSSGMTQILRDQMPVERVVQHTEIDGLDLITTGPMVENPADLLMAPQFGHFLDEVRDRYDLIVIDTSPILAVTDPALIGSMADGVLLVATPTSLSHHEAHETLEGLRGLETPVLGVVFNRVDQARAGYGYGYGIQAGSGGDDDAGSPVGLIDPVEIIAPARERDESRNGHAVTRPLR